MFLSASKWTVAAAISVNGHFEKLVILNTMVIYAILKVPHSYQFLMYRTQVQFWNTPPSGCGCFLMSLQEDSADFHFKHVLGWSSVLNAALTVGSSNCLITHKYLYICVVAKGCLAPNIVSNHREIQSLFFKEPIEFCAFTLDISKLVIPPQFPSELSL